MVADPPLAKSTMRQTPSIGNTPLYITVTFEPIMQIKKNPSKYRASLEKGTFLSKIHPITYILLGARGSNDFIYSRDFNSRVIT